MGLKGWLKLYLFLVLGMESPLALRAYFHFDGVDVLGRPWYFGVTLVVVSAALILTLFTWIVVKSGAFDALNKKNR